MYMSNIWEQKRPPEGGCKNAIKYLTNDKRGAIIKIRGEHR